MMIFDLVASQYGYTYEQFIDMTPRLIFGCLEMIQIRKHNDIAVQVNVHGGDMKFKEVKKEMIDFTLKEKELMASRTKAMIQNRIQKNYEKKQCQ